MLVLAGDFANALPLLRELPAANPGEAARQRQLAGGAPRHRRGRGGRRRLSPGAGA